MVKPPERFRAANWQDESGAFDATKTTKNDVLSGIDNPLGTIAFVFYEKQPNGAPNIIDLVSQYRRLTIDPITMMVRFISQFPPSTKTKSIETSLQPNLKAKHGVVATWDDKKQNITLTVDGKDNRK